jgi:hypothetical protein
MNKPERPFGELPKQPNDQTVRQDNALARVVEAVFGQEDPERERRREENKRRCGHYRDRGRGGVA